MYILPNDLQSISPETIPYSLDVDIIKDCSSLQTEIRDVFNVIDKQRADYQNTIEKVSLFIVPSLDWGVHRFSRFSLPYRPMPSFNSMDTTLMFWNTWKPIYNPKPGLKDEGLWWIQHRFSQTPPIPEPLWNFELILDSLVITLDLVSIIVLALDIQS